MDSVSPAAKLDAAAEIRADLAHLHKKRAGLWIGLTLLFGFIIAGLAIASPPEGGLAADPKWGAAMALFFTAASLTTSTAVGFPLWTRVGAFVITLGSAIGLVVGLALVAGGPTTYPIMATGAPCLSSGTVVAAIGLIVTAAISGRVWRRMEDISWGLAVGASALGLAFLNARCPMTDPVHLFGFHLPCIIGGFLLARGLLSARRRAR